MRLKSNIYMPLSSKGRGHAEDETHSTLAVPKRIAESGQISCETQTRTAALVMKG